MPNVFKTGSNGTSKEPGHHRWNYVDHSLQFVDWVNRLGVEKTFFGRIAYFLDHHLMIRKVVLLFFFAFGLAFLMTFDFDLSLTKYKEGEIAASNVKSPVTFEMVDEIETQKKRDTAEATIPIVFDYDVGAYERLMDRVYKTFREFRKLTNEAWPKGEIDREEKIKEFLKYQPKFEDALGGVVIPTRAFEWLLENRFNVHIENILIRVLEENSDEKIVDNLSALNLSADKDKKVIIRIVEKGGTGEEFTAPLASMSERNHIVQKLDLNTVRGGKQFTGDGRTQLTRIAQALLIPNVTANLQETASRKGRASHTISPTFISLKKGQVIVPAGSPVQPVHLKIFEKIQDLNSDKHKDFNAFIVAVMLVAVVLVFVSYLRRFTLKRVAVSTKDLVAMGVVTFIVVFLCRVMMFLSAAALEDHLPIVIPTTAFIYALPIAAGSMLVGLLITSGEVVWIYSVFMAVVVSLMVESIEALLIVGLVAGIAGARGVFKCRKRNDVYFAGIRTGLINIVMIAGVTLATQGSFAGNWNTLLWNIGAGFFSGIFSALLTLMLIPLLESVFNYTTDVRLLELGNLDHPLLKEMIVKAPGTYHHSLVVGSMVEAAAEEIGANPLLAKVSSYYHDIGKTGHAAYFIENQRQGNNPHDHLSPHLSKTVLISHVKDGVELATQYKLGQPIIDVIIQHHGTTLISFFYNKAKENQDADLREVVEDEFRYPGPKPQFREAALCMLADSIEAAARSLDEPTPIRLQNIVKNIIHRKFMDGQLEECNLTLRDLSLIEQSFIRILLGIYHQRIDYPRAAGGGASETPPSSMSPPTAPSSPQIA